MKALLFALTAACVASCGTPAKLNYFTLAPSTGVASPPTSTGPSVLVGPVTIPEGVDRAQMVRRLDPNRVEMSEVDRWAEPLKAAIPRVIADALAGELATATVMTSRQSAALAFDYRVAVDVERFDYSAAEGAAIDALWTIRTAKDTPPRTGRSQVREGAGSGNPEAMAAAQSRALQSLAREIAAAIRAMPRS